MEGSCKVLEALKGAGAEALSLLEASGGLWRLLETRLRGPVLEVVRNLELLTLLPGFQAPGPEENSSRYLASAGERPLRLLGPKTIL